MKEFKDYYNGKQEYNENLLGDVVAFFGTKIPDEAFEKIIEKIIHNEKMIDRIIDQIFSSKKLLSKVMDEMERKILSK